MWDRCQYTPICVRAVYINISILSIFDRICIPQFMSIHTQLSTSISVFLCLSTHLSLRSQLSYLSYLIRRIMIEFKYQHELSADLFTSNVINQKINHFSLYIVSNIIIYAFTKEFFGPDPILKSLKASSTYSILGNFFFLL